MAEETTWNGAPAQGRRNGRFTPSGGNGFSGGNAVRDMIFDRIPPHDDDAEMAVLGGMLMSKDAIGEVSQMIDVTDFYQPKHQTIYEAIITLFSGSQPVDVVLVANELLTWERNHSYNVGFDLAMWNGRLGVEFDAFYNYIFDILGSNSGKPASMGGYYPTYVNNNAQDVRGIDVRLTHRNHIGKDFQYGVTVNLTWAKDRWLRYQDSPNTPDYAKRIGKSRYMTMGFIADGLFQSEEEIDRSPWISGSRPRVGDIKYKDLRPGPRLHRPRPAPAVQRQHQPQRLVEGPRVRHPVHRRRRLRRLADGNLLQPQRGQHDLHPSLQGRSQLAALPRRTGLDARESRREISASVAQPAQHEQRLRLVVLVPRRQVPASEVRAPGLHAAESVDRQAAHPESEGLRRRQQPLHLVGTARGHRPRMAGCDQRILSAAAHGRGRPRNLVLTDKIQDP